MSALLRVLNVYLRLVEKRRNAKFTTLDVPRARLERTAKRLFKMPPGTVETENSVNHGALQQILLSPPGASDTRVVLFLHGGGYVRGSADTHKHLAAALAQRIGARAVVPDYRLAPENPFPAAVDDALAAYRALIDTDQRPAEIILAGDSSGGGLALALLHVICTENLPKPAYVVAFSPWVDMTMRAKSITRNAERDALVPASRMAEVIEMVLAGADPKDPRASPLFGAFTGAPPVLIQASRAEVLEDDAQHMADALTAQGVPVELRYWQETPHVWQIFQGIVRESDEALNHAAAFVKRHLA
ncbi:MAG: alpha/beta hydrolase [Pseudomonadota bacterium]